VLRVFLQQKGMSACLSYQQYQTQDRTITTGNGNSSHHSRLILPLVRMTWGIGNSDGGGEPPTMRRADRSARLLKRKRPIRHLISSTCNRLTCNEEERGCSGFLSSFSFYLSHSL